MRASAAVCLLVTLLVTGSAVRSEEMPEGALQCLALNVYWEAGAEDPLGMLAVAHVTLNRVRSSNFPNEICAVVQQGGEQPLLGCQFQWWCDGEPDTPSEPERWRAAQAAALAALSGETPDPTGGALYFHAESVLPTWARERPMTVRIGGHRFYR